MNYLQVVVVLIWERHVGSLVHLLLVLSEKLGVHSGGRGGEGYTSNEFLQSG